jgi:putative tryptophan/tyrosine transport system substrate-binding protein
MFQPNRWAWRPQAGPQQALVLCPLKEIFFGGTRGGGKTDGVLGKWALKERRYGSHFNAIMFRKTTTVEQVLRELAKIGFSDIRKAVAWRNEMVAREDEEAGKGEDGVVRDALGASRSNADKIHTGNKRQDRQSARARRAANVARARRRGDRVRRREFLMLLGGAAVTRPLLARAQQPAMPVIGYLHSGSPGPVAYQVAAFNQGLNETGYIEGQNVAIEHRWAEGHYDRLPALASDLVGRNVSVLAPAGGIPPALAAKAATTTIPIVFLMGSDPLKAGVVTSFNRPQGNVTGVSFLINSLGTKRVELLSQMAPRVSTIGMLANPTNPDAEIETRDGQTAAQALGRKLLVVKASTENEFEAAFATLVEQGAGALAVAGDPFFLGKGLSQIITLAARHKMPAIYILRQYPEAGGLMSYGTSITDALFFSERRRIIISAAAARLPTIWNTRVFAEDDGLLSYGIDEADSFRRAAGYVAKILKGAKAGELPVELPVKFELLINLRTAQALGITVPSTLLARADEVIE